MIRKYSVHRNYSTIIQLNIKLIEFMTLVIQLREFLQLQDIWHNWYTAVIYLYYLPQ